MSDDRQAELKALLEPPVLKALQVQLDHKDLPEQQDQLVKPDLLDQQVLRVHKEHKVV